MSSQSPTIEQTTGLQLGDIITIDAPKNPNLHEHNFLIKYLDNEAIRLIDDKTLKEITLTIDDEGNLDDESIESISIVDRLDEPGYAKQNGLIPQKWIDLHFGGDVPAIITGQVTNLDEDMIELRTFPDGDTIYLDFAYKGIPKDLPIEKIVIREAPEAARVEKDEEDTEKAEEPESEIATGLPEESDILEPGDKELVLEVPVADVKTKLREMLVSADEIVFGAELEEVTQDVEVSEGEQRYGIDHQTNDLLDELLSTIPNTQRTQTVLNKINQMIQRFVQLRQEFSTFDERGNANMPQLLGALHKPLIQSLDQLNHNLQWVLPIAKNRKKLFLYHGGDENNSEDIITVDMAERLNDASSIIGNYQSNNIQGGVNRYDYLIKQLSKVYTPFEDADIDNEESYLVQRRVKENITAVIDNLGDFYSSVAKSQFALTARYLITRYNLGESRLQTERTATGNTLIKRTPLVKSDNMDIIGVLTLPEPVANYSRCQLPKTNIMKKAELSRHSLNYWQILRKNVSVTTTIVEDIDKPIDYDKEQFLRNIRAYFLDESITDDDKYEKFLNVVFPKTKVLFTLIKKHLRHTYSLHAVLEYLEPFLVYHKDLSFKQYDAITAYIQYQIKQFKKSYAMAKREYDIIKSIKIAQADGKELIELLDQTHLQTLGFSVRKLFDTYGIADSSSDDIKQRTPRFTMEQLQTMLRTDNARAYTSLLALSHMELMVPNVDVEVAIRQDIIDIEQDVENIKQRDACAGYVVAKKYITREDMTDDNDADIVFDKQFDKTRYELSKKFADEMRDMPKSQLIDFLASYLMKETDMNETAAKREAEAIQEGKRLVKDGDYAVLVEEDEDGNVTFTNFVRNANRWVPSDVEENLLPTLDNAAFCLSQEKCVISNDDCVSSEIPLVNGEINELKRSVDYFSDLYPEKRKQLESLITRKANDDIAMLTISVANEKANADKYEIQRYNIGLRAEDYGVQDSPFAALRDLILAQGDFVKKQYDIIRFVDKFTYSALGNEDDPNWLYCNASGIKLLPSFFERLARAFIVEPEYYMNELDKICAERGTLSDDGENWVDKYSGYIIRPVDFDTEEGFTQQGYRIKTREQLEEDIGNAVFTETEGSGAKRFESPEAQMVSKVVISMTGFMGVNISQQIEFIVRNTLIKQKQSLPSKEAYERLITRSAQSGKKTKMPPYEEAFDSSLLYFTFSYILVAIQSSIPPVRTNKTFPGCKRAFNGYPMNDNTDMSALKYVACVAHGLKSKHKPWNSIKGATEANIMTKMKAIIDKYIINDPEVREKYDEAAAYKLLQKEEDIPIEHDIKTWINFLPPLVSPEVKRLENVSSTFKDNLVSNLKSGNATQFEQLRVMQVKIVNFSIAIQELIQKTINKQLPLLVNSLDEPFLQNACCETTELSTRGYFVKKEPNIEVYNTVVKDLTAALYEIGDMAKAPMLYDPRDTKRRYPELSGIFSEDTIMRAFITYCRFNSDLPIPQALQSVCLAKPDEISPNDTTETIIDKLRESGRVYTTESLDSLMSAVNKENIVHLNLDPTIVSKIQGLRAQLRVLADDSNNDRVMDREITKLLLDVLDVFDMEIPKDVSVPELRKLRNLLSSKKEEEQAYVLEFIRSNATKMTKSRLDRLREYLGDPMSFKPTSSTPLLTAEQNATFIGLLYITNAIRNIATVFPNMIVNEISPDNFLVPKHWNLSKNHENDVIEIVAKLYEAFFAFDGETSLKPILTNVIRVLKPLIEIVNTTPYLARRPGVENVTTVIDEVTIKLLANYYLIHSLYVYTKSIDEQEDLIKTAAADIETTPALNTLVEEGEEAAGMADALELIRGEKQSVAQKVANFVSSMITVLHKMKSSIDYSHKEVMDKVLRAKEREKDLIVDKLKQMTDEQRDIENYFKRAKIGRWGKGLTKGLVQYVPEDYDEERMEIERQALIEREAGKLHMVTEMNKEIFMLDVEEDMRTANEIEAEEYDLSYMGEDDDDQYEPDE